MSRRISIASLDYDQIRANLKEFLRGQAQFTDYDFEGSNMAILLDVLAYNTHYNAMYMNMALNESFLDSASRRASVVSHANTLGYTPRSYTCASTLIQFAVTGVQSPPSFLTIAKWTPFTGIKDSVRYTFYTTEDVSAEYNEDTQAYEFDEVEVIEGTPITSAFAYTSKNAFTIPNVNVDVGTLRVRVQENPSSTVYTNFVSGNDIEKVYSDSNVYFLREVDSGAYEISFGDDVIGKQLAEGNIINLEYFVCSGEDPNGIRSLSYAGDSIEGGSIESLFLLEPVGGGRYPETTEEVRFNAPNFYASQNRAVTALDYETIILSKVPSIEAVSVWGGENNDPPIYGKVFISAKTASGRDLTTAEKTTITRDVLDRYKVVTVIPEFVDPEYIEVELDVVVYYDTTLTNKSAAQLKADITTALVSYNDTELEKFNRILRTSAIGRTIDAVDPSIVSCVPRMRIRRTMTPIYSKDSNYTLNVGNPFTAGTILSTGFYITDYEPIVYIDDDGAGALTLFSVTDGVRTDIRTVGDVDYDAGTINITNLNIRRSVDAELKFAIVPSAADVASLLNQIVTLDTSLLKVAVVADESTKGRVFSGNRFQFTSSKL